MSEIEKAGTDCSALSDADLLRETRYLAERARHNEIHLLSHLAELDSRRLCLEEGFRSLYEYCTLSLGFEEGEAYRRIRVARVIRGFPEAKAALEQKKVNASHLVVLSPWLEPGNVKEWLEAAHGKTRRELESLVAIRYPQAPQPDFVRNLPAQSSLVSAAPPMSLEIGEPAARHDNQPGPGLGPTPVPAQAPLDGGPPQMIPITTDRVRVGFDAASALAQMIERMRQLLRHKYPEGRLEDLIREAVSDYLDRKDPDRKLELKAAKSTSAAPTIGSLEPVDGRLPTRYMRSWATGRYIPAKVKSAVWARDKGSCAWRNKDGTACGSKDWIEYDHITPYARGGRSDDPRNLRLVCRQHNQAAALAAGFSVGRPAS